jgi:hypothetical protein
VTAPHLPRRGPVAAVLLCVVLLTSATAGCSNDDESSSTTTADTRQVYCDAWADLINAFEAYDDIDIINGGIDSVRTYFEDLDAAATTLEGAATDQLGVETQAFTDAVDDLGTTLVSSSLPVDRRAQVRDAAEAVDTAWNDLVAAFAAGCPSVTADTVDADAV